MMDNWTSHCSSLWGCTQPFFSRKQCFPHFVAALLLTISRCFISLSVSEKWSCKFEMKFQTCTKLESWKGERVKSRVSWGLGCKLDEMWGHSWPFSLPVWVQFMGGGAGTTHACKMQTHPALHAARTGFCAVVQKPVWKISVMSK